MAHRFGYRENYKDDDLSFSVFDREGEYTTNLFVSDTEDFSILKELIERDDVDGVIEAVNHARDYFKEQRELFAKAVKGSFALDGGVAEKFSVYLNEDRSDEEKAILGKFFARLGENPNIHSQDNLFDWLGSKDNSLRITDDGMIVGYRGLTSGFMSRNHGYAIVNGEVSPDGPVDNHIGNTVEMPRHMVNHDPRQGCSFGLHVGTNGYATGWASGGKVVVVLVDPADVVSVPTDCGAAKMRVCKYKVVAEVGSFEVHTTEFHMESAA